MDREQFLKEAQVTVLTTLGPDGAPHSAPMWYLYEGGVFKMITGARSQKARNVARRPQVSLVMDRRERPYYAVMIQGEAEVGPPPTPEFRFRLVAHYLGEAGARAYVGENRTDGMALLIVRPTRLAEFPSRSGTARE